MTASTGGTTPEVATSLNHLANTTGNTPTTAANIWAGHATAGAALELVGALNVVAGNDSSTVAKQPRELAGVCNQLAKTSGLEPQAALALLAFGPSGSGDTWGSETLTWAQSSETWANS